jgi:ABC-type dipeptide/oligopeptide/nickel transport system permease component
MISFVLRRLLQSLIVVLVLSLVLFVGLWLIGNPVDVLISSEATDADRLAAMKALGLDRPIWEQYFVFLGNAVQGDWGNSACRPASNWRWWLSSSPSAFPFRPASMPVSGRNRNSAAPS